LKHSSIFFKDEEGELIWYKNKCTGLYTTKLGYMVKTKEKGVVENKWWWKKVWKLKNPKTRNLFCLGNVM
jgi:hypothetical protein